MRHVFLALIACVLSSCHLMAQHAANTDHTANLSLTASGRQHHPIQTSNPEAQAYFDQGLTLVYGFNHEEAARAFTQAAKLDPKSPMPLWGAALAVGPNYNMDVDADREKLAYETIQKAIQLSANSPQVERDYIAALATRYSAEANPDYKKLSRDYADAMKSLSQKYPEDLDAATLYAESLMNLNPWKLWSHDGKPGENTEEIVNVLESVIARDPNHAGANHYYIHAVEASPNPSRALPSAERLETLVPQAGHLVHMPAHIYIRTGDYAQAAKSNEVAIVADRSYAKEADRSGSLYDLMYHSHNEHFLAAAASLQGRYAEAKRAADAMAARLQPHVQMMPMLDAFVATPLWVEARFSKWDAILARREPAKEQLVTHLMWRYARTCALAAHHESQKAEAEFALFQKEAEQIPSDTRFGDQNVAKEIIAVATHVLSARIAAAKNNLEDAIAHWREAVAAQDAMNYAEPPDWYYPVRESLGAALLASKNPKEAESVFREDLRHNPRNPRSLFGLHEALVQQRMDSDAAWVKRQFTAAWKDADTELKLENF